ncbi:MAG: hypothetical protein ACK4SF_05900 [Algoriphagus aquaeductus]|uniref:hypothetical protein n=1 Tax=Algoriphagus aquaeductus TaxID=475299 RepID=UPI0039189428
MNTLRKIGKIWALFFIGLALLGWVVSVFEQKDLSGVCFFLFFVGVLGYSVPQMFATEKGDRNAGILITAIAAAVSLIFWYVLNL